MNFNLVRKGIVVFCLISGLEVFGLTAPNISANALFLSRNSNFHADDSSFVSPDQAPNGINLQEAELQFYADVDPYTRLSLLFSIAPEYVSDGTRISEAWGIEPEEAFAESNIVSGINFKVGKFKAAMGKHNILHSHAYPLIEAPLVNEMLLGSEGLNDSGLSAAVLVPTSWFNEFTLQYFRGQGGNSEFNSPSPGGGVGLVHWKNLVDLTDELTIELGASYANGGNKYRQSTTLTGADLTFKWRPSKGGRYHSLLWTTEFLSRNQSQQETPNEVGTGFASLLQYQLAERWSAIYRYDNLEIKETFDPAGLPNDKWERHSVALAYAPSEFSVYKVEYDQRHGGPTNSKNENTEKSIFLQANFTIGAHPSHSY